MFAFYSTINDFNDFKRSMHTHARSVRTQSLAKYGPAQPQPICVHVSLSHTRTLTFECRAEVPVSRETNKLFIADFENGIASRRHIRTNKYNYAMCARAFTVAIRLLICFCDVFQLKRFRRRKRARQTATCRLHMCVCV